MSGRQFPVRCNRTWRAAETWSDSSLRGRYRVEVVRYGATCRAPPSSAASAGAAGKYRASAELSRQTVGQ